jgi:hypothetical protein
MVKHLDVANRQLLGLKGQGKGGRGGATGWTCGQGTSQRMPECCKSERTWSTHLFLCPLCPVGIVHCGLNWKPEGRVAWAAHFLEVRLLRHKAGQKNELGTEQVENGQHSSR